MQLLKLDFQSYHLKPGTAAVVALLPLIIVVGSILFREISITEPYMRWLYRENHPVELMTFATLLIAGILGCRIAGKTWITSGTEIERPYRIFYAVFGVGLLFVAMEEISWGQWFFFYDTPDAIKSINRQGEMNIHNLPALNGPFEMLRVAFGVGGLIGIAFSYLKATKPIGAPPLLVFWFIPIAVLASLDVRNYYVPYDRDSIYGLAAKHVELLELLIGCTALLYMWLNGRRIASVKNVV